jgi:N-acetylmuramic acid 6-phosphate etherase
VSTRKAMNLQCKCVESSGRDRPPSFASGKPIFEFFVARSQGQMGARNLFRSSDPLNSALPKNLRCAFAAANSPVRIGLAKTSDPKILRAMTKRQKARAKPLFLGIECGGTRSTFVITENDPTFYWQGKVGPANLRLLSDEQLVRHFRAIGNSLPKPSALAIAMAGTRTEADRERIRRAAAKVWPGIPCYATNDLETALEAADGPIDHPGSRSIWRKDFGTGDRSVDGRDADRIGMIPRVLVLSGTGSCCFGRTWDGKTAKVGGWGHILGDKGSGFEIGLRALKAVVYYYDRDGAWSKLGQRILRKLLLNEPDDLIGWVQTAGKDEIASLTLEVFNAWAQRDKIAADILEGAAQSLAGDAASCAGALVKEGAPVQFVLAGGVLLNQPRFAKKVAALLRQLWSNAIVTPLKRESVWGAVKLAKRQLQVSGFKSRPGWSRFSIAEPHEGPALPSLESLELSPTEQRNPRSLNLDRVSLVEAIVLMLSEDEKIPRSILAERKKIEQAVKLIVRSFKRGGRLFYVGAGTSGRLGVLDASECPPTFRTPPERVQGIIAGGQRALWEAVEGAEDDAGAGARAIQFRGVGRKDVVVGIAASGRTPFVWGALWEAGRRGAKTVLVCFNPQLEIPRRYRPDLILAPNVGPEILTGSTRLKSGTATKLILNIFTTLAMARTGKVISNLMVDLNPSNVKLRDRAVRIVRELTGTDSATANAALEESGWVVKKAWQRLKP